MARKSHAGKRGHQFAERIPLQPAPADVGPCSRLRTTRAHQPHPRVVLAVTTVPDPSWPGSWRPVSDPVTASGSDRPAPDSPEGSRPVSSLPPDHLKSATAGHASVGRRRVMPILASQLATRRIAPDSAAFWQQSWNRCEAHYSGVMTGRPAREQHAPSERVPRSLCTPSGGPTHVAVRGAVPRPLVELAGDAAADLRQPLRRVVQRRAGRRSRRIRFNAVRPI